VGQPRGPALAGRTPHAREDKQDNRQNHSDIMSGYYELKLTTTGKPMFNLKAGNHEIILTSEIYESKAAALNGIDSVRRNGPNQNAYEKRTSVKGEPYFVLKATNGQVIGKSEMYSSDAACDKGIASVMNNCTSEKIVEVEAKA